MEVDARVRGVERGGAQWSGYRKREEGKGASCGVQWI